MIGFQFGAVLQHDSTWPSVGHRPSVSDGCDVSQWRMRLEDSAWVATDASDEFQPLATGGSPTWNSSVVVALVLVPRGQQQDIKVTNCKQDDAPTMAKWNDEFPELTV